MLSNNIFIASGVDYLNEFNSRKCFSFLLHIQYVTRIVEGWKKIIQFLKKIQST